MNTTTISPTRGTLRLLLALVLSVLLAAHLPGAARAQAALPSWADAGAVHGQIGCVDPSEPNTLILIEEGKTVRYNWVTRQRTVIQQQPTYTCVNGFLFSAGATEQWRYSLRDLTPVRVEHLPTDWSDDGSPQVYSVAGRRLWASANAGLSWQERGAQLGAIVDVAVAPSDARTIYVLTVARPDTIGDNGTQYAIHASSDAGATWEQRYAAQVVETDAWLRYSFVIEPLRGYGVPATGVALHITRSRSHSYHAQVLASLDGARTFHAAAEATDQGALALIYANGWLLRTQTVPNQQSYGRYYNSYALSEDAGRSWRPLEGPFTAEPAEGAQHRASFITGGNALAGVIVNAPSGHWYAPTAGAGWRQLSDQPGYLYVTPYLPTTLLAPGPTSGGATPLRALQLPDEGRLRTARVAASDSRNQEFYPETGHNMSPLFRQYWQRNGGLAQFGYPKTEPFRELNPADGKVYLVQYFERNRFEYHPELAGTAYEVLLGLLGNQFTAQRGAEPPFQRVPGATQPDAIYFPETGHTLRGAFKPYWEKHGGLAMYGYPISEEFLERNEDDGRTYIVQYFERARFEYHEENKNTRYEVLLGLLGNKLLRQKGWE